VNRNTPQDKSTTSPRLHLLSPLSYPGARQEIKHQPVPIASPPTALSPHPPLFVYKYTTRDPPTTSPRLHLLSPLSYRSARHEIKHQPVPIASPTTALSPHPSLLHTTRPAHNLASPAPADTPCIYRRMTRDEPPNPPTRLASNCSLSPHPLLSRTGTRQPTTSPPLQLLNCAYP